MLFISSDDHIYLLGNQILESFNLLIVLFLIVLDLIFQTLALALHTLNKIWIQESKESFNVVKSSSKFSNLNVTIRLIFFKIIKFQRFLVNFLVKDLNFFRFYVILLWIILNNLKKLTAFLISTITIASFKLWLIDTILELIIVLLK